MVNNFNWTDENQTILDGGRWEDGTLSSENTITQIGNLEIRGNSKTKRLDARLDNTGTIVENHSIIRYFILEDGAVLNNSGNYELRGGRIHKSGNDVATFNNSGIFTKTNRGTGEINVNFNNTGTVNIEEGTLEIDGNGESDGGIFNLDSGGTLNFTGFSDTVYTIKNGTKINGSGNLQVSDDVTLDLQLAGETTIADTLSLTLEGGTFQVDGDLSLPSINNWDGGILRSPGVITNSGNLVIGGNRPIKTLDAQLENTGTIVENHSEIAFFTFEDGAILNNSGNYELQSGRIHKSGNDVATFNNSGIFTKTTTNTGLIDVNFNNTGTVNVESGTLNFNGTYTHNDANLVIKGGEVNFSNDLDINGGSLAGNGDIKVGVTNTGLINPAHYNNTEIGSLNIDESYSETDSASIDIQIGGDTPGVSFDQFNINGASEFHGTLNISLADGFTPTLGDSFDILNYDSLALLSELDFTGLEIDSNLQFVPEWFEDKLTLKVVDKSTISDIIVTTTEDIINSDDGKLSLREAIIEANRNGLTNTINLGEGTYSLDIAGFGEDLAATGDLDILPRGGGLIIQGQGKNNTILDAKSLDRFFEIHADTGVILSGVTITGGLANRGGAIANAGTASILNSEFRNNQAIGADGFKGADGRDGKADVMDGQRFPRKGEDGSPGEIGETAQGGAVFNSGKLNLTNTLFDQNQARGGTGGNGGNGGKGSLSDFSPPLGGDGGIGGNGGNSEGGAIYNSGELNLKNSTVSNNQVSGSNGGDGGTGGLGGTKIATLEEGASGENGSGGNAGNSYGGAIYNSNTGKLVIDNNQFANNSASAQGIPGSGLNNGLLGIADNGDANGIYNQGESIIPQQPVSESNIDEGTQNQLEDNFDNDTEDDLIADNTNNDTQNDVSTDNSSNNSDIDSNMTESDVVSDTSIFETIDLTNSGDRTVKFTVNREASFNNTVGFYEIISEDGSVMDTITGEAIAPGEEGYQNAVLANSLDVSLSVANQQSAEFTTELSGGLQYGTFIIVNGNISELLDNDTSNNPEIYFASAGANIDSFDHIRSLGENSFGYEDLPGGGDMDFNDLVVTYEFV